LEVSKTRRCQTGEVFHSMNIKEILAYYSEYKKKIPKMSS